jgi:hypothetical protein
MFVAAPMRWLVAWLGCFSPFCWFRGAVFDSVALSWQWLFLVSGMSSSVGFMRR